MRPPALVTLDRLDDPVSTLDFRSDPRWKLIERILLTSPFKKSAHLPAVLRYLAEHSICGHFDALTEREIGMAAFGKPLGYSPAEDSAVRVHIRQLRLRLHEYFACDGHNEQMVVDIPKGSYVLYFHTAQPEVLPPLVVTPTIQLPETKTRRVSIRDALFWVALLTAGLCAAGWYRAERTIVIPSVPWPLNAVIQQNRETRVVVSDGSFDAAAPGFSGTLARTVSSTQLRREPDSSAYGRECLSLSGLHCGFAANLVCGPGCSVNT